MPIVTYKGETATISSNTSTLVKASALVIDSLIMFQKIANVLSIVSFLMVASMSGGTYFAYKYVTSEQFKTRVMNEIMGNVQTLMPKVLDNAMPDISGPSIPLPKK